MAEETLTRVRIRVVGRVQGVFYRQSTRDQAVQLRLSGWVRNEMDGSVLIDAVGDRAALQKLIDWCRKGPPSARVDRVETEWTNSEVVDFGTGFEIER